MNNYNQRVIKKTSRHQLYYHQLGLINKISPDSKKLYLKRFAFWLTWPILLFSEITTGALRYGLNQIGAVSLAYIPKFLVVLFAMLSFCSPRQSPVIFNLMIGIIFFSFVALLHGLPQQQIAFGLTIFLPLIFGTRFWPYAALNEKRFVRLAIMALIVVYSGLLFNVLNGSVPWEGFEYEMGGVTIEGARKWTTFGINRPSGFARTSAVASIHVMLLVLLIYPVIAKKSRLGALIYSLFGLVIIILTTNKSAVGAMLVMLLLSVRNRFNFHRYVLGIIVFLSVVLPYISTIVNFNIAHDDLISEILLASLDDRLTATWPEGIKLISQYSVPGLGRGLSGVGAGEVVFGTIKTDSHGFGLGFGVMDNYPLYLYGNFGLFGLLFLVLQMIASMRLIESTVLIKRGLGLASGGLLIFGFATDAMENLLSATVMGIALSAAWSRTI